MCLGVVNDPSPDNDDIIAGKTKMKVAKISNQSLKNHLNHQMKLKHVSGYPKEMMILL